MSLSAIQNDAPFLRVGPRVRTMEHWTLAALLTLLAAYAWKTDLGFLAKFGGGLAIAWGLQAVYTLLRDGRPEWRPAGSVITAAILLASIPPSIPWNCLVYALVVAVVLARLPVGERGIFLNPALVGRLFLMIAYSGREAVWNYPIRGANLDALTGATPLELFSEEESMSAIVNLRHLFLGTLKEHDWDGMWWVVPGSPGEMFPLLLLGLGAILVWKRVLDWRAGVAFVVSFAITIAALYVPLAREFVADAPTEFSLPGVLARITLFQVLGGAVLFAAVFIAGDPSSTPRSAGGKYLAGILAGVINAVIRKFTFYAEGMVFAFLTVNLLAPTLDRLAFHLRSWSLRRNKARFDADLKAENRIHP